MTTEELARAIAASMARHQSRGLVDDAKSLADVVVHGRIDLLAVADDVLLAFNPAPVLNPLSWGSWFARGVADRRKARRQAVMRALLLEQLDSGLSAADAAIARLKLRSLEAAATSND